MRQEIPDVDRDDVFFFFLKMAIDGRYQVGFW